MITNLFRRKQTEPAPEPVADALSIALAEESAAAAIVLETSARCSALDTEHRTWEQRRDAAYREFCAALARHAEANERLAAASKPAILAGGSVVAAVPVEAR